MLIVIHVHRCGHCKTLAPIYEEVATNLKGRVNVAKIDVTANRDLGVRFDIKGFPTVKLLHKGDVFNFQGRRSASDLEYFATEGYALSEPAAVPKPLGTFGEVTHAFSGAWVKAQKDIKNGNYFTPDIILVSMPLIFIILLIAMIAIPMNDPNLNRPPPRAPSSPKKRSAPNSPIRTSPPASPMASPLASPSTNVDKRD